MQNISRSERNIAHRLIEEFMPRGQPRRRGYLLSAGSNLCHRVHEKPDRQSLEFEELARAFAIHSASEICITRNYRGPRAGSRAGKSRPADTYGTAGSVA